VKVFLCQSYLGPPSSAAPIVFPIGLAYIASSIQNEHEVYCWDPNVSEDPVNELPRKLEKIAPDVVGLSLRNVDSAVSAIHEWYFPRFVSMVKAIRERAPSCKIVVGGAGFSLFAEEVMRRTPEIDFGVILQGEQVFAQLLRNLNHPEKVSNIVFRKDGKIRFTEQHEVKGFESLPPPSRDLFDLQAYKKKSYSMNVLSKRGCGFNCIFCPNNFLSGYNNYGLRSAKSVVDEIEQMKNTYDIDSVRFADSTFNFPFDHARKICQEMAKRKLDIEWTADFHAAFMNEPFTREAVQSGCSVLNFSPDGASDKALTMLQKGMRFEDIKKTIALTKKVEGAKASYSFMYDFPGHNSDHSAGLSRLIVSMVTKLRGKLGGFCMTRMRIYPHSPLYDLAIKEGKISATASLLAPVYYRAISPLSLENLSIKLISKSYYMVEAAKRGLEGNR
jgi:anaerobic magnesium-protoporphyrin IX monomethyl ester cyclase